MAYTTLWVRPGALDYHYAGPYGTGDGSSYANAIAGLMNVPWTTPSLQVIVAGVHVKRWTSGTPTVTTHASIPVQGGTADEPTIVRGDASRFNSAATDAVIIGGMMDQYSPAWTHMGGDVWQQISTRYSYSDVSWTYRVTGTETKLTDFIYILPVQTLAECQATVDTMHISQFGNPHTVYVHLPPGVNPNTNFGYQIYGYRFKNYPVSRIIYYGIQFGFFQAFDLTAAGTGTYIEWRRCKMWYGNHLVPITGTKPGNIVDRCHLRYGGSGVYIFSVQGPPVQLSGGVRVTASHITDIGYEYFNEQTSDAHAIASRHGVDNYYIDGVNTERTGHPIVMYNYSWGACKNVTIKRCSVRDPHSHYRAPDWDGIAFNPANSHDSVAWDTYDSSNNRVERCYVNAFNMDGAIRNGVSVEYIGDTDKLFKVLDCQVDNGNYGIQFGNGTATNERSSTGIVLRNVLRGQIGRHFMQAGGTDARKIRARTGGLTINNNKYIRVGANPPFAVKFGNSDLTLTQWKAESVNFDADSVEILT